jgi:Tfp pilus assembly protein PilX
MIDLRQNKGFALVFSLIFLFLIVSFMAVYILAVANGVSQANRTANLKKAYYIADAGLADAYERITQSGINTIPSSTPGSPYIPSASTDNGVYSVGAITGNYTVSVAYSNVPRSNYTITSTGTYGQVSKTLQLKIIGAAISKYAYWSQTENNPAFGGALWWVGEPGLEMLTTGPVQTNGTLNIFGNPIFNGAVTEGGPNPNYYPGVASNPNIIFPYGLTNNSPNINLPALQTLNAINAIASDGSGLVLTGASTVVFNPTGTITVTGKVKNSSGTVTATYSNTTIPAPANGVVYVKSNAGQTDGNVTIQGTVKGQLTVAADQNINVSGSVAYNSDPRTYPSSTDLLGLVANQNITVIEASAPTQLEMSAVMVALQGSFQVDQWWVNRGNAQTAVMDQFGSLINYVCGATGEMDMSGNLLGGWNQIQAYDSRLATMAPPGFPPYVNNAGNGVYTKVNIMECNSGVCG